MSFRDEVEKGLGAVVILAGSGSDAEHVKKITSALVTYGIPFDVRVASAHKQTEKLAALVREYDSMKGPLVYIAVAGGTDALSGTISWASIRPVISCPPDAPNQSCLTNPPGSSNVYVARPDNAARFVAQMFSSCNPDYATAIINANAKKISDLENDDKRLRKEIAGREY